MELKVNITEENDERLRRAQELTKLSIETLVNDAIARFTRDELIKHRAAPHDWKQRLQRGAGLWANRTDLPDFDALRRSWDRDPWADANARQPAEGTGQENQSDQK